MLIRKILSGLLWAGYGILVVVWTPLLALVFIATAPFDPGRYVAGRMFRIAAVTAVKMNPLWRFSTSGLVIDDPRRPYVVVSNHESYADIFLISHLPWEMKWLSKDTIFRIPFMGWMMRMAGDIEVRRGDASSRAYAFAEMRDRLAKGVSVMIFPEGTRSPGEDLLRFRDGAFRVAIETGTPILPLAVAGTRGAMKKHSFIFEPARAEVRVLEPIETAGLTLRDLSELRDRIRDRIDSERKALRASLQSV